MENRQVVPTRLGAANFALDLSRDYFKAVVVGVFGVFFLVLVTFDQKLFSVLHFWLVFSSIPLLKSPVSAFFHKSLPENNWKKYNS